MLLSREVYFYYIGGWSIIIYIMHPFDFAWTPCISEQGKKVLGFSAGGSTRTDRWAVLGWCCCLVLRPGPQTADWCKTETRGWSGWREGKERERVEAKARVTVRDGRGEEGGVGVEGDIIEPVWVSRLTELQGVVLAHRCCRVVPLKSSLSPGSFDGCSWHLRVKVNSEILNKRNLPIETFRIDF